MSTRANARVRWFSTSEARAGSPRARQGVELPLQLDHEGVVVLGRRDQLVDSLDDVVGAEGLGHAGLPLAVMVGRAVPGSRWRRVRTTRHGGWGRGRGRLGRSGEAQIAGTTGPATSADRASCRISCAPAGVSGPRARPRRWRHVPSLPPAPSATSSIIWRVTRPWCERILHLKDDPCLRARHPTYRATSGCPLGKRPREPLGLGNYR